MGNRTRGKGRQDPEPWDFRNFPNLCPCVFLTEANQWGLPRIHLTSRIFPYSRGGRHSPLSTPPGRARPNPWARGSSCRTTWNRGGRLSTKSRESSRRRTILRSLTARRSSRGRWTTNGPRAGKSNTGEFFFTCLSSVSSWALVGGVSCLQPFWNGLTFDKRALACRQVSHLKQVNVIYQTRATWREGCTLLLLCCRICKHLLDGPRARAIEQRKAGHTHWRCVPHLFPSVALEQRALHAPLLQAFVQALGDRLSVARLGAVHDGNPAREKRGGVELVRECCGAVAVRHISVGNFGRRSANALPCAWGTATATKPVPSAERSVICLVSGERTKDAIRKARDRRRCALAALFKGEKHPAD